MILAVTNEVSQSVGNSVPWNAIKFQTYGYLAQLTASANFLVIGAFKKDRRNLR